MTQYLVYFKTSIPPAWIAVVDIIIFGNTILGFIFLRKSVVLEEQDNLIRQQARHIQNLEEMIRNIRAQRHDFISHLQAVYGMLQMGKPESARAYLAEVTADIRILSQTLRLKQPEVAALIQQKAALAASRNISFGLIVESDLEKLAMRPYNLNRILGNLLDNAMEAVVFLATGDRYIRLEIGEDEQCYIISVSNSGPEIEEEIKEKIFETGFSTKGENRGLGLAIVREIVEHHGGQVRLTSQPTTFTVTLPKAG
ncbi:sensor histidine kinase [Desulfofundulus sp.]|uniref:sensor histidine kinase n=1 Tax=Desulfofundulus sp. TaxID=2282750 RepID=UPI003C7107BD